LTRDGLATSPTRHTPHGSRLETYLRVTEETGRSEFTRVIRSEEGELYSNDVIRHLLQTEEHPTAIFAGHDELAIGALHAIQDLGVDISIVGYDNVPIASHPVLSLTSVDQQGERMGARAVELLLERISGRTDAVHERFTTTCRCADPVGVHPPADRIWPLLRVGATVGMRVSCTVATAFRELPQLSQRGCRASSRRTSPSVIPEKSWAQSSASRRRSTRRDERHHRPTVEAGSVVDVPDDARR